ncbi:MAG: 2-hydroxyhepta-2,4-diene-1,7-dioate isomerase [Proteobacteria bacterium]|jgi:2-keto-4-pentenoate hydratase/2-oxohepta-3-ene-1,7-dioic acid hydratase (catechol pathway)|nr:MAG: 2-hydroxyhepta-2,4-diene-1,7-dioate isomerase [Pseudomonadota bacterium]HEX5599728.1 fumarylacetoacetate hydrolase family protein [Hyphomicrobiaceae bacterium]
MKLVRFGAPGAEKPGIIDADGVIRDVSAHVSDFDGPNLSPASLDKLRKLDLKSLPAAPAGVRLGPPVARTMNFIAVGLNYEDHARETNMPIPAEPILFNKLANCIIGPNDDVMIPKGSQKLDWEVEIAFVVGTRARYVEEKDALNYIAGYTICNDVSERYFQIERGGQWMKGKCFETSGPLGPWLVTPDEIEDVQNLDMWLDVNGKRMQIGNTRTMIFSIKYLLHYISQFMVLEPGDVVTTGTPPGVGMGMNPPVFLKAGDVMKLHIQGLGEQTQRVVPFKE